MIEFNCASCGKLISAGEEQAGQQCSCPCCGVVQVVPQAGEPAAPGVSGIATAAFVLGLCSIVFGVFTAIPAIILAIIAVAKGARGKGLAVAGFFCALILGSGNFLLVYYLLNRPKYPGRGAIMCQSNVRSIGLAVAQYANEYNDWLPMCYEGCDTRISRDYVIGATYAWELSEFLGCKDDPWFEGGFWEPGAPAILTCPLERKDFGDHILAYGWNWESLGANIRPSGTWWIRRKVDEVARPGETSCLGESRPMDKGRMFEFDPLETTIYWGGLCPRVSYPDNYYMGRRHDGGANYLCVDGHVEFARYDDLVDDWQGSQRIFSRGD